MNAQVSNKPATTGWRRVCPIGPGSCVVCAGGSRTSVATKASSAMATATAYGNTWTPTCSIQAPRPTEARMNPTDPQTRICP